MKFLAGLILTISIVLFMSDAQGQKKQFTAVVDKDGIQRAEVLASEFYFDPDHIIVKVNVPVELKIRKEPSMMPHEIVLKAPEAGLDIHEQLSSEPKVIKFTATKTGKYDFYCGKKFLFFESHRDKGMVGVLEVRE